MSINQKLLDAARKVTAHRARVVINHIIEYGFITTEDLKNTYGYNHPPRAAGDVRDQGIPLDTFKVIGSDGRKIGAYKFGDPDKIEDGKLGGRKILPKKLKIDLIEKFGAKCAITCEYYNGVYLQIDHRIPYRITGDTQEETRNIADFMLLCGSAQRQKSWACEHCENFLKSKEIEVCKNCYWAYPECYEHVAMNKEKRIDIIFQPDEIYIYNKLEERAKINGSSIKDELLNIVKINI